MYPTYPNYSAMSMMNNNIPTMNNNIPNMNNPIQNGINWVQGIEGAKAFQMPINGNAIMLDSENDGIFYIKTSDNVGMCSLRTFKFTEITNSQSQKINPDEYVKKSELESLIQRYIGGENEQSISATKPKKSTNKLITE